MLIEPKTLALNFEKLKEGELIRRALSTGFDDIDPLMRLAKGYMAIISGYPGSGKSELLDAILVNMTLLHNWRVLFYSPENHPIEQHMAKLAEKYIGKNISEFTKDNIEESLDYMSRHFLWTDPEEPTLENIFIAANRAREEGGLDCLVIDPWNAVIHKRSGAELIHEYLATALTNVIRFAREKDILVAIVAHPTKPQKEKDGTFPMPTLYDISDGAMWRNKADYGFIVHRPDMGKNEIIFSMQKVKQKHLGKVGVTYLDYCYRTGRFKCKSEKEFLTPIDIRPPF